ncbi:head closure Hc2 [Cronobacter phage LPCS28]|uniref:Neck protein n=1 Tax=Cronobacter phage LPCS28 TaxID=2924885 RepID=A0AAE9GBQ2_9CAUD|nr:head closure Hc2 [Cronobacter phage LPCS28]UNY47131.1 hypothetical protein EHEKIMEA_00249 [Cronobacter phage LPCS28]
MNQSLFATLEEKKGYERTRVKNVLNPYVNFHKHENTQTLADVLVAESIQMRGVESYYIRREFVQLDTLFGEDLQNKFKKAYKVAIYINSFDSYEGQREFFSKFQMSVQDEITFSINPGLFKHQADGQEPKEGDLIYFPMDNSLFELVWVEPRDPFYQVGKNAIRKITATKFVYSGEELQPELQNTGLDMEFDVSSLELEPVRALDGKADITIEDFKEDQNNHDEAKEFVKEFTVINGRGTEYDNGFKQSQSEPEDVFKDPFADL